MEALRKNTWLLAMCGFLQAAVSVIYFRMQNQDGPLTLSAWSGPGTLVGGLMLAAAAFSIGAGIGRLQASQRWPLVLNGLALGALGLISTGLFGLRKLPISFRTIALLFVAMAISAGILELASAQKLARMGRAADGWLFRLAGAVSGAFALAFLAMGLRWIRFDPGFYFRALPDFLWWKADFLWFAAYFGFSALGIAGLAARWNRPGPRTAGKPLPPFGSPAPVA
jgi:uncharacterized membrane protein HdeD (DUF308 family)